MFEPLWPCEQQQVKVAIEIKYVFDPVVRRLLLGDTHFGLLLYHWKNREQS